MRPVWDAGGMGSGGLDLDLQWGGDGVWRWCGDGVWMGWGWGGDGVDPAWQEGSIVPSIDFIVATTSCPHFHTWERNMW